MQFAPASAYNAACLDPAGDPTPVIDTLLNLDFGRGGNAENHLGPGWSAGEQGFRWMIGETSELWLEHPGPCDCLLEVLLNPLIKPPDVPVQRMVLAVRGTVVAQATLRYGGTFGFHLPAAAMAGPGPVRLVFGHPDCRRPSELSNAKDDRLLAIAILGARLLRLPVEAVASPLAPAPAHWGAWAGGLPEHEPPPPEPPLDDEALRAMVLRFESLGDNCEFGLVQRRCGAEPLGLLRFSNIELSHLLRGIRCGFAGLGEPSTMRLRDDAAKTEYVVDETVYRITYHTFLYKKDVAEDGLLARQSNRLKFLVRKMMEDIRNAEKIFVLKRNRPLQLEEVLPLYATLNEAAANTLLWVVPADEGHPPGSVERVLPGLLRGYVDRFAPPENAPDLSLEVWLEICRNTCRLVDAGRAGVGAAASVPVQ
jgi:hypothetical protein